MQAEDIMTRNIIQVPPDANVRDIAELMLAHAISAVPVVDLNGRLLGMVSEGDLMRRPETGTERRPSWWLSLIKDPHEKAVEYIRSHGRVARDVMSGDLITTTADASLEEVAETLERNRIKRVPVLDDGALVGIVSRADLLRGLVAARARQTPTRDDAKIKAAVQKALSEVTNRPELISVVVSGGVISLWGMVESDTEKRAVNLAANDAPGAKDVRDHINILPHGVRSLTWDA